MYTYAPPGTIEGLRSAYGQCDAHAYEWQIAFHTDTPAHTHVYIHTRSAYRECDAGTVLSEMTDLQDTMQRFAGEASARYLQRMIVKAPAVTLDVGKVLKHAWSAC